MHNILHRKAIAVLLLLVFLFTLTPAPSVLAAYYAVLVTLPPFTVTLNGQPCDNDYSRYPPLVYQNITYFPMTYHDSRLLGLTADWTEEQGLVIEPYEDYFYEYFREVEHNRNKKLQTALIAKDAITVNGKVIDNSKEEYPLLVFRGVTYFPLTWRFAVEEFGWDYHFDTQKGLTVNNEKVKLENPEEWEIGDIQSGVTGRGNDLSVEIYPHSFSFNDGTKSFEGTSISLSELAKNRAVLEKYANGKKISVEELSVLLNNTVDPKQRASLWKVFNNIYRDIGVSDMIEDKSLRFIDARMEYQIHKKTPDGYKLTYRYLLPVLNDKIPYSAWATYEFISDFWLRPEITPGTYRVSIWHPDYFNAYDAVSDQTIRFDLNGPCGARFFPFELEVTY